MPPPAGRGRLASAGLKQCQPWHAPAGTSRTGHPQLRGHQGNHRLHRKCGQFETRHKRRVIANAAAALDNLGWFFIAGQFVTAGPQGTGSAEARVLADGWMKAVVPVRAVPRATAAAVLDTLVVKGRAAKDNYDRQHLADDPLNLIRRRSRRPTTCG